jgi:membrane protease YdiL (CAAX protease family)
MAPLREELLFRGITVPALERIGGPWLAVIGSGVVFAVAHPWIDAHPWLQNVADLASIFIDGMVQAWIFLKTRSLAVVILLHSVSNLFINLQRVILLCYPDFVRGLFLVN